MLTRTNRRVLLLLIVLVLALTAQALAEQMTVYTANDGAKVYDAEGQVLGTLPANTKLTLTGVKGKVCRVEHGGKTAYMLKEDLAQAAELETPAPAATPTHAPSRTVTAYVARDGAKVYDADGDAIGALNLNDSVTVTAVNGSACAVSVSGRTGYMKKADLSADPVAKATATPEPAATATPEPFESTTAYVNADGAKVYSAKGGTLGTLGANTAVTVTAAKGNVCRVSANGHIGYMKKSDLSASPVAVVPTVTPQPTATPTPVNATAYAAEDDVKVYSAGGSVLGTLELNDAVTVTAVKGNICQVTAGGRTGYVSLSELSEKKTVAAPTATPAPTGGSTVTPAKGTAKEMDWWTSDIQTIFARGVVAQITDVETGLSWRERRNGGTNHADCQPLTAADTAAMKKAYGGTWSWNRRAVFVTINGVNYAASINGMPHGSGSITDNNFNGHHCIHFTNSRTHGSNKVCPLHQAAIKKAASTTL